MGGFLFIDFHVFIFFGDVLHCMFSNTTSFFLLSVGKTENLLLYFQAIISFIINPHYSVMDGGAANKNR